MIYTHKNNSQPHTCYINTLSYNFEQKATTGNHVCDVLSETSTIKLFIHYNSLKIYQEVGYKSAS